MSASTGARGCGGFGPGKMGDEHRPCYVAPVKWKIAIALGLGVVLLAAAAIIFGPSQLEDTVEEQLAQRLERRGIEASWKAFDSAWGTTYVFEGLEVHSDRHGISLAADSVSVELSTDGLLEGEPRLESIEVERADLAVDLEKLTESEDEEDAASTTSSDESLTQRILRNLPDIEVLDGRLTTLWGDQVLMRAASPQTRVIVDERVVTVGTSGSVELVDRRFRELAGESLPVTFDLRADLETADFSLDLAGTEGALLSVDKEEFGAEFMRLTAHANWRDTTVQIATPEMRMRIGSREAPALDARLADAVFSRKSTGRFDLLVKKPEILVTPQERTELKRFLRPVKSDERAVEAKPIAGKPVGTRAVRRWMRRASFVLDRTDIDLVDGAIDIRVANEDESYNTLRVIERFELDSSQGTLEARAETAEGQVSAYASFLPGQPIPQHLTLDIVDVNLGEIPGMPSERSKLPNRGTSGRIAGIMNLHLAIVAPPLGIRGAGGAFDTVSGVIDLDWDDGVVDLTGVSEDPIENIDMQTRFEFVWNPALARLDISDGRFEYGKVDVDFDGGIWGYPLDTTFMVDAEMEELSCEDTIRSLPNSQLGRYKHIELEGEWAPKMYFKLPIYSPRRLKLKFEDYEDLCKITSLNVKKPNWPDVKFALVAPTGPHPSVNGFPPDYVPETRSDVYWLNRPFIKRVSEGVSDPKNSEVYVGPGLESYVPLNELPPWVGAAAFLSEQMMFYEDPAISIPLIKKAMRLNLEKGRFVYGGSTVTQQLVKNLFLTRDKTLSRKLREAILSWRITQVISKDRVLELYLNCIEFGPDIYGIGPAAQYYFQKDARDLTARESIFLAMLKPAPWYGPKVVRRGATPITGYWATRTEELFGRLIDKGFVTQAQAEAEKPYKMEWDDDGGYIDPDARDEVPAILPLEF